MAEWENTVLSRKKIKELAKNLPSEWRKKYGPLNWVERHQILQAKATWEAAEKHFKEYPCCDNCDQELLGMAKSEGIEEGRQEVVEWCLWRTR